MGLMSSTADSTAFSESQLRSALRRAIEGVYPIAAVQLADVEGVERDRLVLRVTARCNQRCPFCQAALSNTQADPSLETLVRAAGRMASALPRCQVILTGGEPTLRPDMAELTSEVCAMDGVAALEVQTNAVRIGQSPNRIAWPRSHKLRFLVAAHGFDNEVYDACTGTRGLLADAIAGIKHLLGQGYEVEINHVATSLNVERLSHSVERLAELFPTAPKPRLHFSVLGIPEHRDVTELHVAYDALVVALDRALDRAQELGVPCVVALSASHARIPACALTRSERLRDLPVPSHEHDLDGKGAKDWWYKPETCEICRDRTVCLGLPRSYVDKFPSAEVEPIGDEKP